MNYKKHLKNNIEPKKKSEIKQRLWLPYIMAAIAFCTLIIGILVWCHKAEKQSRMIPEYTQESINPYLTHSPHTFTEEDYQFLFQQTGLTQAGIDYLFANNRQQELLTLQENLFKELAITCDANTIITCEERIGVDEKSAHIPYVEEGDILITFNCHALGWRNGHAALVVDAGKRLTLEARVLGTDSAVISMEHWETYPSFAVLRLKNATEEQRAKIAAYAEKYLCDVPYRLESGILERMKERFTLGNRKVIAEKVIDKKTMTENVKEVTNGANVDLPGTHCAHLIWYAYKQFGYDLDSDGGIIVTPRDLFESEELEIVQIFGM